MADRPVKGGHAKDPVVRAAKRARAVAEGRMSEAPAHDPFEAGNVLSVVHGAFSDRIVALRANARLESVLSDPGFPDHVKAPYVRDSLKSWCWIRARIELLWEMCENLGPEKALEELTRSDERVKFFDGGSRRRSSQSKMSSVEETLRRWETLSVAYARELGLTPLALAKLGKDVAAGQRDLASYWAEIEKQ